MLQVLYKFNSITKSLDFFYKTWIYKKFGALKRLSFFLYKKPILQKSL